VQWARSGSSVLGIKRSAAARSSMNGQQDQSLATIKKCSVKLTEWPVHQQDPLPLTTNGEYPGLHLHQNFFLAPHCVGGNNPTTPHSTEEGQIYCILLMYFFSVTCLKLVAFRLVIHHYKHLFLYFYFNTARDVVIVFLISVDVHHFHETFAHMHMYAHINKHTLIIIAQKEW